MKDMKEMCDKKWMKWKDNQDQGHMEEGWKYVGVWMENG